MLSRSVRFITLGILLVAGSALASVDHSARKGSGPKKKGMKMEITSSAFQPGKPIPAKHTCQGQNLSPALEWEGEPARTKSVALIVDDPDAPSKVWVHWVIFNLPSGQGALPEGMARDPILANGTRQGMNDSGQSGWDGPCPPPGGPHRYYFRLYAIDKVLGLEAKCTKEQLLAAMKGHILAEGSLMGTFQRR